MLSFQGNHLITSITGLTDRRWCCRHLETKGLIPHGYVFALYLPINKNIEIVAYMYPLFYCHPSHQTPHCLRLAIVSAQAAF